MTSRASSKPDAVDALNSAIAQRIGLLRKGRHLSLEALALRSGVSKGMVVQMEQGRANPSIGTLCRLAAGLGVSVTDLLAETDGTPGAVQGVGAGEAKTLWVGPKGGSAVLRVGTQGPDMLELWSWCLYPGERYEARAHGVGTTELLYVETGVLAVEADGEMHQITAGACARAQTDRPHAYACAGNKKTVFSMVVYEPAAGPAVKARRTKGTL